MVEPQSHQNIPKKPTAPSQININLSPTGQLNYEGELNQESAEILEKLLQQAEYYRSKSKESESEKTEAKQKIDAITMVFLGCCLTLLFFVTYQVVASISGFFTHTQTSSTYRTYDP